jgi:hypothetical protein
MIPQDVKERIAHAATEVTEQPYIEIDQVVSPNEDRGIGLTDRLASAAACFFVSGASYAMCWLLIAFILGRGAVEIPASIAKIWLLGWRWIAYLTLITTLCGFLAPNRTVRIFGDLMLPFTKLFTFDR